MQRVGGPWRDIRRGVALGDPDSRGDVLVWLETLENADELMPESGSA